MKALLTTVLFLGALISAFAQTREIYTNPNFKNLAKDHKVLAILPFKTTLQLRPKEVEKNGGPAGVAALEKREGLGVQSAVHSYFLKRKESNDIFVDFQDPARTNALLERNAVTYETLASFTPEELAKILKVDGIVSGTFESTQPMSDGAAIAMTLAVGFGGATNTGKTTISINDGKTGELLWKYDKTLSRGFGSNTSSIITTIMRKASRQFPYDRDFKE
ncbi:MULTISPECIES: hypothetical protein [unclassified Spirosoma]|uniref:hypothetical protein n=1 Tax=unclassified Spirosoma TaxID=2621999 RepID=UPI0009599928|nr:MULTISPECIES: hypothetical protein [unclassified Spirosoma]MBN8826407.1 hypothetical protein [Spirosoma sp.]OJW75797.1 MAG: hypothetical protein BGO59_04760 [Spirosoma sp. 48-14]